MDIGSLLKNYFLFLGFHDSWIEYAELLSYPPEQGVGINADVYALLAISIFSLV